MVILFRKLVLEKVYVSTGKHDFLNYISNKVLLSSA